MCPRPDVRPCELAQQGEAAFVGFVIRTEPRSFGDVLDQLQQMLPAKLVQAFHKESLTAQEAREAITYLVPNAEFSTFLASSDADLQTYFKTRFFQRHVQIRVTEAFRGIEEQEVEFITGFTSCAFNFKENRSYLIYADRDQASHQFGTGACSGNAPIESAGEELTYLRGLKAGTLQSQVFGFVTRDPWDNGTFGHVTKPVADVPIALKSEGKSWHASTDQEGAYEFAGLPSGAFEIWATLPNAAPEHSSRKFDLTAGACVRQDFLSIRTGSISGSLTDSDGNPVQGVLVDIEAVPPTPQPHPLSREFTDQEGRFSQIKLEAGDYVLGLNLESPPNARDYYGKRVPYSRSYYPGVTDRANAQVLHLEPGQIIENLEFKLPAAPQPLTLTGTVVWPSGSPAKADVMLMDLGYSQESSQVDSARTKSDGRFTITGVQGRPYILFAHISGRNYHFHSEALDMAQTDDKPIRLELLEKEPDDACKICKRFTHFR
jgi:5-hydroxyisourate hydrolase-like protein (transthyretin family)